MILMQIYKKLIPKIIFQTGYNTGKVSAIQIILYSVSIY